MIATDRLADGKLLTLPPEAGDVNAPRFEPNPDWLRSASAVEQKTAMWRWFATRYEELDADAPRDERSGAVLADRVLHDRFDACVPREVVDQLVHSLQAEAGNERLRERHVESGVPA